MRFLVERLKSELLFFAIGQLADLPLKSLCGCDRLLVRSRRIQERFHKNPSGVLCKSQSFVFTDCAYSSFLCGHPQKIRSRGATQPGGLLDRLFFFARHSRIESLVARWRCGCHSWPSVKCTANRHTRQVRGSSDNGIMQLVAAMRGSSQPPQIF